MTDYQIQNNTRRCTISGRELQPGEKYFSVLFDEQGSFVRRDFSAECWSSAPEGAFSFWAGKLPLEQGARRAPIDDEMLFECLRRLDGEMEPAKIKFRYVLALLLMRRKKLKFVEAVREGDHDVLTLQSAQRGERVTVID